MDIDLIFIAQSTVHYFLHLVFPGIIAYAFFRDEWKKVWALMLATMLIDLDHLLATPIFDPSRCSIGFHPLHSYLAIVIYFAMLFIPNKTIRIVGIGLVLHIITDAQDCLWKCFIV